MFKEFAYTLAATLFLAVALVAAPALSKDKAPMPQTRGMQGMYPKAHTVDCPDGHVPREKPAHVHKAP